MVACNANVRLRRSDARLHLEAFLLLAIAVLHEEVDAIVVVDVVAHWGALHRTNSRATGTVVVVVVGKQEAGHSKAEQGRTHLEIDFIDRHVIHGAARGAYLILHAAIACEWTSDLVGLRDATNPAPHRVSHIHTALR